MSRMRIAAASLIAPLLAVALAAPAEAGSTWTYRADGSAASVDWVEMGALSGVGGNVHVGSLWVDGSSSQAYAYGHVVDWTCPDGELPPSDGHDDFAGHEAEEPETNCVVESTRFIDGDSMQFSVDRKLNTARMTGTLFVEDHEGGSGGAPLADITWTGIGETSSSTSYSKYTDSNGNRWQSRYSSTERAAEVDGFIGAMGFADDADDQSSGWLERFKIHERSVSK